MQKLFSLTQSIMSAILVINCFALSSLFTGINISIAESVYK